MQNYWGSKRNFHWQQATKCPYIIIDTVEIFQQRTCANNMTRDKQIQSVISVVRHSEARAHRKCVVSSMVRGWTLFTGVCVKHFQALRHQT
jgi:hypothetical protein